MKSVICIYSCHSKYTVTDLLLFGYLCLSAVGGQIQGKADRVATFSLSDDLAAIHNVFLHFCTRSMKLLKLYKTGAIFEYGINKSVWLLRIEP